MEQRIGGCRVSQAEWRVLKFSEQTRRSTAGICLALAAPHVDVIGISTVHGNVVRHLTFFHLRSTVGMHA